MESQPQNPEFRIHPKNFHPCKFHASIMVVLEIKFDDRAVM